MRIIAILSALHRLSSAARLAARILTWAALTVIAGVVLAFIVIPKVMGWVPLTVLSGSMRPTLPVGSEIVVRPVDTPEQLRAIALGDVITFMPHPDDPTLVTHRVVGLQRASDGSVAFTTQGDDNPTPDPDPVLGKQVRGVLLYHAPLVGRITTLLPSDGKRLGVAAVAVLLIGYGLWQVTGGLRARRRDTAGHGRHRAARATAMPDRDSALS